MTTLTINARVVCGCAVCQQDIFECDTMADHKVYKLGELSYIELAHKSCAIEYNAKNFIRNYPKYWEY